ncbi:MAG TPA: hypothetical protein VFC31_02070 [Candidatus Limnocylindria bacterium]|nr:hypothetical protein [Candidatus Limnocylindria bacterium]
MDDRVALRVGLLRLARQHRSLREAAWAAARLRLEGVRLETGDARFARDALVRFGRAVRVARARRDHETGHELAVLTFDDGKPRSRRLLQGLVVVAGLVALIVTLFVSRGPAGPADEQAAGGGTPAAGIALPTASPLRGRSQELVVVVPVVTRPATPPPGPTPDLEEPINAPRLPAPGAGGAGTGGSGGGLGGGTGAGTGGGSGPGVSTATPAPTPTPTVPVTVMVLEITVTDASTRIGLPGVCVVDGLTTCANAAITDAFGHARLRLSIGQLWHLEFKRAGYYTQELDVISNAPSKAVAVALIPAR